MYMRDLFPGYYRPTPKEFDQLWKGGIFVFDANVLLHIYRFTPETRQQFLDILQRLQTQIWIPHQVAYEFSKDRIEVINQQLNAYDLVKVLLHDAVQKVQTGLNSYRKHAFIEASLVLEPLRESVKTIEAYLD